MQHQEILARLAVDPTEIIYAVTMEVVLTAIVNRLGEEALSLPAERKYIGANISKPYRLNMNIYIQYLYNFYFLTIVLNELLNINNKKVTSNFSINNDHITYRTSKNY